MTPYDIILKKRLRLELEQAEIAFFIRGFCDGSIADYQMTAFLMAVLLNGLTDSERLHLTLEMMRSGRVFDLSGLASPRLDKHSTGGVGDGVSISLAPLIASFGVTVPMMSGRGLGHTGGTLDKLESIPGFRVFLTPDEVMSGLSGTGAVFFGQTDEVVPADRRMYGLRDVTATVDSMDLIASSIMSKKLAEGVDGILLDVKAGRGAFMRTVPDAVRLAKMMLNIGRQAGRRMTALVTDMDQPLGRSAGNAPEVAEQIEILKGRGSADLIELVTTMAAELLRMAGKAPDRTRGIEMAAANIANGKALAKLAQIIGNQGGDPGVLEDPTRLSRPQSERPILSPSSGWIADIDPLTVGRAAVRLGAGRLKASDSVDSAAGFSRMKKKGERVEAGEPLAFAEGTAGPAMDEASGLYLSAVKIVQYKTRPAGHPVLRTFKA